MEFRARPIFQRQLEATEAHLTAVFTALAVARFMQAVTGLSLKKIIMTLRPLREFAGENDGHELVFPPDFTPTAAESVGRIGNHGHGQGH